jgi:16S rRNA (cytidine1402-2'-O)-methyltransferase
MTQRSLEALRSCDVVACEDTRRTGGLLNHLDIEKPLMRFDDHAGLEATDRVTTALAAGKTVAYCSDAGMPGVNDPGFELARMARGMGVKVTVLPGPSAVTLAVVASGLPSHAFSFWGYLPSRSEPRKAALRRLTAQEETVVVFETPHRILETLQELLEIVPERELALGRELTKLHETWYRGTPAQVAAALGSEGRGEMVLVMAGADAKRTVTDPDPVFDEEEGLPDWALRFLDAAREGGMTLRDAVKPLARHLGLTPSDAYRLAVNRPIPG